MLDSNENQVAAQYISNHKSQSELYLSKKAERYCWTWSISMECSLCDIIEAALLFAASNMGALRGIVMWKKKEDGQADKGALSTIVVRFC